MTARAPLQSASDHVEALEDKAEESCQKVQRQADAVMESARRLRRKLTPPRPLRLVLDDDPDPSAA